MCHITSFFVVFFSTAYKLHAFYFMMVLCKIFSVNKAVEASFIEKSCATPIALDISLINNAMEEITVIAVICMYIVGAVFAPSPAKILK